MRKLLVTAMLSAAFALPAIAQGADVPLTLEAVAKTQEQAQQSSWYGEPLGGNGQDVVPFLAEGGPVKGNQAFIDNADDAKRRGAAR